MPQRVEIVKRIQIGGGLVTTVVRGDVGSVRAAIEAGKAAAQRAAGDPHQIDEDRDSPGPGRCPRAPHGRHAVIGDIAQVHGQHRRAGRDLRCLLRMRCHNRACPDSQHQIGRIIHRYGMGDTVDQRRLLPHLLPHRAEPPCHFLLFDHIPSPPASVEIRPASHCGKAP